MRKPQFELVIGLLTIFFVLALIRNNFEKYIPQLPPNKLANLPGAFLRAAVHQPVDWEPSPNEAFLRAVALKRPVLFVLGSQCSKLGALLDNRIFSNWSVASEINTAFVPVRVDIDEHPEWSSAVFPISRMKTGFFNDIQLFSMDPYGRLERFIEPPQDLSQIEPATFLDLLTATRREFDEDQNSRELATATAIQRQDVMELTSASPRQLPSFDQYSNALNDSISPAQGAFVESNYLRMLPYAWLYLARINHRNTLALSLDRFLLSPAVDVLRGGFFDIDESRSDQLDVGFSEKTVPNASMASLLAELGVTMHEKFYAAIGQRTFDMIMRDLTANQLLVACRPSDEDLLSDRSPTASLTAAKLNQILSPSQLAWANQNLNLGQNRQEVPFLSVKGSMLSPDFEAVCHKLREGQPRLTVTELEQYLDINGNSLASLCRCARIWGDPVRMRQVRNSISALESFTSGFEISHTRQPAEASTDLNDYLAFADAQLQFYLATGENSHFVEGRQTLGRAINTFLDRSRHSFLNYSFVERDPLPRDFDNPQIADPDGESTTAQAIRLCLAFGRMLGPTTQGHFLTRLASDQVSKYSGLSAATSPSLAGYYLAAADLADPACAFAVGPNALQESNELYRLRPNRLISPAGKYVRPDLNRKAPGIYVVSGSLISGPFTVAKAAQLLPPFSQVGVTPEDE